MLVTKKRLYTELCKVMDTVHGAIDLIECEKYKRKSDVRKLSEQVEWNAGWATKNFNKLDQRIDYVLDEIHALGELKPAKKTTKTKDKTVKMYVIHRFLDGKHMFDTICNTKKQLNTEIANVVADTRVWATDHGVKNAGSGKVTYKTRTVTDQGE